MRCGESDYTLLWQRVPQWCWIRVAPATASSGWLWEMRLAIVARVRDRDPMDVADDLGHVFGDLLPYGRPSVHNRPTRIVQSWQHYILF